MITVQVHGLIEKQHYTCRAYVIDAQHSGFAADWLAKSKEIRRIRREVDIDAVGSIYDSEVAAILEEKDRAFWRQCKQEYAAQQHLEQAAAVWNDQTRELMASVGGHGVLLIEWIPE